MASGRAAVFRRAALDVGVESAGGVEILLHGEDDLGGFRRQLAAVIGLARLHDHRMALRRALDHQRAAHREMPALVVEEMHLGGVEIHAARLVGDDGVVLEAVPQPEHDLREFPCPRVALGMRRVGLVAEIQRLGGGERGDQVPAGAAVADLVERREEARHRERLVIGRRHGGDEADALGDHRERAEQGERLEPRARAGSAPDVDVVGAEGRVGVGGEQEIELAALGGAGDLRILLDAQPRPGIDVGVAPGGDVMSAALEEQAELHLSRWSTGRGVVHRAASRGLQATRVPPDAA